MNTHTPSARAFIARIAVITVLIGSIVIPRNALAASSWSPTLLVNTEAFQEIDDGDGASNIELRFGTSTQTMKFLTNGKFQLSHGLSVLGTISGSRLNVDRNATIGGTFTVSGATSLRSMLSVTTTASGNVVHAEKVLQSSGSLSVEGGASVQGNLSGRTLSVDLGATISGSLLVKNNIAAKGALSGSTIFGGGLGTCTGTDRALQYNVTTGKFTCTVLSTGSFSNTGSLQTSFDKRFVNQAGDTMTGSLIIRSASGVSAVNLNVIGGVSGAFLRVSGPAAIHGALNVTGSILSEGDLTLGGDDAAANVVLTFMNSGNDETITWLDTADKFQFTDDISVVGIISGSLLRIDGSADIQGAINASGSILTEGDLTVGGDDVATDVTVTFMNSGTDETLKWMDTLDKFQFSDDVSVVGHLSGSALQIDGNASISGSLVVKTSIASKGSLSGTTFYGAGLGTCTAAGYGLQYDPGTGKFTCTNIASGAGNGSGFIMSFHPEYPNAIYFASGANMVGQMTMSGGTSALDNSYIWTSSRNTIQDYWVSVRARLPNNFSSWDSAKPIEYRYKTSAASAFTNHTTIRIKDTAGVERPLTGGGNLANTSWTTATVTGPESGGTWAAKGYITVYVKMATTSTGSVATGFINLNYESTTP